MKKAMAFIIEVDHGHLLYSLGKLHQISLPSDKERFAEVVRLWVSVYNVSMNDFCLKIERFEKTCML